MLGLSAAALGNKVIDTVQFYWIKFVETTRCMFFDSKGQTSGKPLLTPDLLLAYGAGYKKLVKGELLFREGATPSFFYWLEEGRIKMYNTYDDDKEFIQGYFDAGESLGEPAFFTQQLYPANAAAMGDALVLRLNNAHFAAMLAEQQHLCFEFALLMARRLLGKSVMLRDLLHSSPEERILSVFKQFKHHMFGSSSAAVAIPFTRQEIADMCGLRVETVIRTIKTLEDRGLLAIHNRKVLF